MKIFNKNTVKITFFLIFVAVCALAAFEYSNSQPNKILNERWKIDLKEENYEYKSNLKEEDVNSVKEFYREQIAVNNYRIENNIPPQEALTINTWSFISKSSDLIQLLSVFVIIVSSTIISSEFKTGTIKLLMIKPFSRFKILLSKYITTCIYAFSLLSFLFLSSYLLGTTLFGLESNNDIVYMNGMVEERPQLISIIINYLSTSIKFIMLSTLAFMVSTCFENEGMPIATSILLYFLGTNATVFIALGNDWAKYVLFANTNLKKYFTSEGPIVDEMTFGFSLIILFLYWCLFLMISVIVFQRKPI